ncbi:MAG: cytochrome C [Burkholderiales bacterium PBB5]|nr:MAG: cytochrome C [Burkholderiales bacterium PBB5]
MASPRHLVAACMAAVAVAAAASPDAARARVHYLHHCSGCHLADGSGSPAKGIPSMRGVLGQFLKVPGGREFIVQVPGVMNSPLADRDIANLMNWLLPALAADTLPTAAPPYTADEIAKLRQTRPADVMAVRAALMQRMREAGIAEKAALPD